MNRGPGSEGLTGELPGAAGLPRSTTEHKGVLDACQDEGGDTGWRSS